MTIHRIQSISEILLASGVITVDQLRVAQQEQSLTHLPIHRLLVDLGFVPESAIAQALESEHQIRSIDLPNTVADPEALALMAKDSALSSRAFPFALDTANNTLHVAVADPTDVLLLDQIRSHTNNEFPIEAWLAREADIFAAIDKYYGHRLSIESVLDELQNGEPHPLVPGEPYAHPIVRLVEALLIDAVKQEASDIHFEPEASFLRIRYRIDGILQLVQVLHHSHWPAMAVRLKVITEMNIAESRAPQDGRLSMHIGGRQVDFRASIQPTIHGENIVLRILDRNKGIVSLENLGLVPNQLDSLKTAIARPEGILLVTGPTGSGKTTTLYSLLHHLNNDRVNIMTLEDPVEYPMANVRQTSLTEAVKLDFASGIRSLMRQDPDIILVGEIRDAATAEMAFRAAMTGHQVFATLHTNSAVGALPRLADIGVSHAILEGNLIGIVAQRLVRKLCHACKTPCSPSPREAEFLDLPPDSVLYRATGCDACKHRGYRGRTVVMELLRLTPELDTLVGRAASSREILQTARQQGFRSMALEGLELVRQGVTDLAELARVIDLTRLH